jgi:succinate-semialdehyde dehydrogenase/glutarate-semialdehyde dehydrogenase
VEDSLKKGAKALTGGSVNEELNAAGGSFFEPTVLTGITKYMAPYYEETFGPVAPLMPFTTEEEAIEIANDTRLANCIWH